MNHYWVSTEDLDPLGHEPAVIWACVEAENKNKAKGQFVSKNRKAIEHAIGGDNPFVIITKVENCMCEHEVCNCEIETPCTLGKPQDPAYDYCGDCMRQYCAEEATKALFDWMENPSPFAAENWKMAVEELFRSLPKPDSAGARIDPYG